MQITRYDFFVGFDNVLCPRSVVYFTLEVALKWNSANDACMESGGTLARAVSNEEAYLLQAFM